jgi:hypothetical protein
MQFTLSPTAVSALITPALLILSCASLIGATAQRLTRVIDRTYRTAEEFQEWLRRPKDAPLRENRLQLLLEQLRRLTRRARILQHSMTALYLSLSALIATSAAMGFVAVTGGQFSWLPISVGLLAVGLLFYASLSLIFESRLALSSVNDEMNLVLQLSDHHTAEARSEEHT